MSTNFTDLQAIGSGYFKTYRDGQLVSQHTQEREAVDACHDLILSFPNSMITYKHDLEVVATLTQAGRDLVDSPDTPDPDPDPLPPPDPTPDPPPIPDPPPPPVQWSNYRGIPDPSSELGFDVYAQYPSDVVLSADAGDFLISESGTAQKPYVVDLNGKVISRLGVTGRYVIVQNGFVATTGEGPVRSQETHVVFRDIDVKGNNTNHGHGSAVGLNNLNVWIRGAVHNFGLVNSTEEQDQHGFKVQADGVWILDVETYQLSGDGVQVGDASRGDGNQVYIGGGYHHDNRENAIDVKNSRDVVISGVRMANFMSVGSSHGEAIVLHDQAFNTKVFDCEIINANLGIVSSGKSGHVINGNRIQARTAGIQLRNTRPITVTENIIDAPLKIQIQGGMSHPDTVIQSF